MTLLPMNPAHELNTAAASLYIELQRQLSSTSSRLPAVVPVLEVTETADIGSILAAVPAVLIAFLQFGLPDALVIAFGYLVISTVIGNFMESTGKGQANAILLGPGVEKPENNYYLRTSNTK